MDFEFTCIYNPDFGTEEDVEPQLVYKSTAGNDSDRFVKLIGVAQGIAELAYSFGNGPVKWFKTGRKGQSKVSIVVPLLCENPDDWRSGFWFTGQMALKQDLLPAEVVYRLVKLAFRQHCLLHGKPPKSSKSPSSAEYWAGFHPAEFGANMASVIAPHAIRLAPGSLNPTSRSEIEQLCKEHSVQGLLITVSENGSSVFNGGGPLRLEIQVAVQNWLEDIIPVAEALRDTAEKHGPVEGRDKPGVRPATKKTGSVASTPDAESAPSSEPASSADPASNAKPTPDAESALTEDGTPVPHTLQHSTLAPGFEDNEPSGDGVPGDGLLGDELHADERASSIFGKTSASMMPNFSSLSAFSSSLTSVSLPSMSMPSLQLPQLSLSSFSPSSVADWWNSPAKAQNIDGLIFLNSKIVDLESEEPLYVTAWRRTLYVYTAVFKEPIREATALALFEGLSTHLDGFSFAFEPPTRFYYLIQNTEKSTVVSTFPDQVVNQEVIRSLTGPMDCEQRVVRLGSTWLYFVQLEGSVQAVFGKKNLNTQQPSLLGALHSDVQQWLEEYARKYL